MDYTSKTVIGLIFEDQSTPVIGCTAVEFLSRPTKKYKNVAMNMFYIPLSDLSY